MVLVVIGIAYPRRRLRCPRQLQYRRNGSSPWMSASDVPEVADAGTRCQNHRSFYKIFYTASILSHLKPNKESLTPKVQDQGPRSSPVSKSVAKRSQDTFVECSWPGAGKMQSSRLRPDIIVEISRTWTSLARLGASMNWGSISRVSL